MKTKEILQLDWVQAPSTQTKKTAPKTKPAHTPKREKRVPANAASVRGLIPHMQRLLTGYGTLDPSSVEIVSVCERVYLCRFIVVNRPDPVLPIVGLDWPTELWKSNAPLAVKTLYNLKEAYVSLAHALSTYNPSRLAFFQETMSFGTNTILQILADGSNELCTDYEYTFTARHLTQAMTHPESYR